MFKIIADLVGSLAWPVTVLIIACTYRSEIKGILHVLPNRATKLSGLGVAVELAASQVAKDHLIEATTSDEKVKTLHDLEIAKAIAPKFDFWMSHYNHPKDQSDREGLLKWLSADRGFIFLSGNYQVFKALAEVVAKMGYDTIPAPTQGAFDLALIEAKDHEEYFKHIVNR